MSQSVWPHRVPPLVRPQTALRLAQSPLTRGIVAYYHISNSPGWYPNSVQVFRNLVTESVPWTYPLVGNTQIVRLAPDRFGGSAFVYPQNLSVTISSVCPVIDTSNTGPGFTIAHWGWYGGLNSTLTNTPTLGLSDGTTSISLALQRTQTQNNTPGLTYNTDVVNAGVTKLRQWTHVAMTFNGLVAILYQNGREVGRVTVASNGPSAADRIQILSNTATFPVYGCEFGVWRRPLAPNEMYALWHPRTRWDILDLPKTYLPLTITPPPVVSFLPRLPLLGMG